MPNNILKSLMTSSSSSLLRMLMAMSTPLYRKMTRERQKKLLTGILLQRPVIARVATRRRKMMVKVEIQIRKVTTKVEILRTRMMERKMVIPRLEMKKRKKTVVAQESSQRERLTYLTMKMSKMSFKRTSP